MPSARLILEPAPLSGARNMAIDETLLESALDFGTTTIRVYQWSVPTVSLGYFQDADEFERDPHWTGLAAVRRLSGGGAILHDREVTYSVSLPPTHAIAAQPSRLYGLVHKALIEVLAAHDITASLRGTHATRVASGSTLNGQIGDPGGTHESINHQPSTINRSLDPFLCFGRGDPNDIVLGAHKIVGSAQRRRRGAILQHGSILLERSPHAAEFPGIGELTGVRLDPAVLSKEVGRAIIEAIGTPSQPSTLDDTEQQRARDLERDRYAHIRWGKSH